MSVFINGSKLTCPEFVVLYKQLIITLYEQKLFSLNVLSLSVLNDCVKGCHNGRVSEHVMFC